ncbi:retrovirus-related pol polyprotein from transposon TNT 1-94 [Tanacetum coccineum]
MSLTYQPHSPKGPVTVSDTEPITHSVPTEVKNTEKESKINELTKLVQMLMDEKINSKTREQKPESSNSGNSSKCELCHYTSHSTDDCYRILYSMRCKEDHKTSDHDMYIASLKRSENYKAQTYQYAPPPKHILKAKAKPFPPCTHYGFNDHRHDDYINYPECEICKSCDHFTSGHNRVILVKEGALVESSRSSLRPTFIILFDDKQGTIFNANKEIVLIAPRRNVVYVLDMSLLTLNGACFFAKASESVLGLPSLVYSKDKPCSACEKGKHKRASFKTKQNFSIRKCLHLLYMDLFGPVSPMFVNHEKYTLVIVNEYLRTVENKNDVKVKQIRTDNGAEYRNSKLECFCDEKGISQNFSFPYTPEQNGHVYEVIAVIEKNTPHTKDVQSPLDLTNTEWTQEQNVQDEQIINHPTDESSGNNTKTSVPTTEPLVSEVSQFQDTNYALRSSYPVAQDRWSKDQHIELINIIGDPGEGLLTRSMAAKLTTASTSECLFADFLSEIEPKKVFEALKHPGWVDVMQ